MLRNVRIRNVLDLHEQVPPRHPAFRNGSGMRLANLCPLRPNLMKRHYLMKSIGPDHLEGTYRVLHVGRLRCRELQQHHLPPELPAAHLLCCLV